MTAPNDYPTATTHSAQCAVLTVSDTRTPDDDEGGRLIRDMLAAAGHSVSHCTIVKDEPAQIEVQLRSWLMDTSLQVILTTGGTGVSQRDTTIEVVNWLIDKPMKGFGELFRMLSWEEVGPAAMLTRTTAGLTGNVFIFALPGSIKAVRLAMQRLILPELPHLLWERKQM